MHVFRKDFLVIILLIVVMTIGSLISPLGVFALLTYVFSSKLTIQR